MPYMDGMGHIHPYKFTYPLTNDGWKLTFLFWDGLFSATLNFGGGTNGISHHQFCQFCPRNMHLTKL